MDSSVRRLWRAAAILLLALSMPVASAALDRNGEIERVDFFKPELAPVRQSGPYDVTVVYFMDYQCPACRKYTPDVTRALNEERKLRVIYRDTPIFGPRSEAAARVAIASQFQGKHEAMHQALMHSPMPLDEEALRAAAKTAGVDWARLQRDLEKRSDEIDAQIAWNLDLANAAGIAGTPAFIVGDVLANGVLNYDGLKAEIADARAKAQPARAPPVETDAEEGAAQPKAAEPAKETVSAEPEPAAQSRPAASAAANVAFEPVAMVPPAEEPAQENSQLAWVWLAALIAVLASAALLVRKRFAP